MRPWVCDRTLMKEGALEVFSRSMLASTKCSRSYSIIVQGKGPRSGFAALGCVCGRTLECVVAQGCVRSYTPQDDVQNVHSKVQ